MKLPELIRVLEEISGPQGEMDRSMVDAKVIVHKANVNTSILFDKPQLMPTVLGARVITKGKHVYVVLTVT